MITGKSVDGCRPLIGQNPHHPHHPWSLIGRNYRLQVVAAVFPGAQVTPSQPPPKKLPPAAVFGQPLQWLHILCNTQGTQYWLTLTSLYFLAKVRQFRVMDTFWPDKHTDPENGVLWKLWKCPKRDQGRKPGASPVLNWNNPEDLETINDLILKKVFLEFPDMIFKTSFCLLISPSRYFPWRASQMFILSNHGNQVATTLHLLFQLLKTTLRCVWKLCRLFLKST